MNDGALQEAPSFSAQLPLIPSNPKYTIFVTPVFVDMTIAREYTRRPGFPLKETPENANIQLHQLP